MFAAAVLIAAACSSTATVDLIAEGELITAARAAAVAAASGPTAAARAFKLRAGLGQIAVAPSAAHGDLEIVVAEPAKLSSSPRAVGPVVKLFSQHRVPAGRIADAASELRLVREPVRRPKVFVVSEVAVPVVQAAVKIDAAIAVMHVVISIERVVVAEVVEIDPSVQAQSAVPRVVKVAPVIVVIMRVDEQVQEQVGEIDDGPGAIIVARPEVDVVVVHQRGEQHSAAGDGQVVIAVDEDIAQRGPDIVRRDPNPLFVIRRPVAGPPGVPSGGPDPAAVAPIIVGRGRQSGRSGLQRRRGRGQVFDFMGVTGRPKARHPGVAPFHLGPIAGNPLAVDRGVTPESADPNPVVQADIPGPIAGNPDDIVPFRLELGRQFFDGRRRWVGDNHAGLVVGNHRFGERFMERAAQQRFGRRRIRRFAGRGQNLLRHRRRGQDQDQVTNGRRPRSTKETRDPAAIG